MPDEKDNPKAEAKPAADKAKAPATAAAKAKAEAAVAEAEKPKTAFAAHMAESDGTNGIMDNHTRSNMLHPDLLDAVEDDEDDDADADDE